MHRHPQRWSEFHQAVIRSSAASPSNLNVQRGLGLVGFRAYRVYGAQGLYRAQGGKGLGFVGFRVYIGFRVYRG